MSDETFRAVEDALRAHAADEYEGALLTDWTVTAACALPGDSDTTGYLYLCSQHTPAHAHLGLAGRGYQHAKAQWDYVDEDDE